MREIGTTNMEYDLEDTFETISRVAKEYKLSAYTLRWLYSNQCSQK